MPEEQLKNARIFNIEEIWLINTYFQFDSLTKGTVKKPTVNRVTVPERNTFMLAFS